MSIFLVFFKDFVYFLRFNYYIRCFILHIHTYRHTHTHKHIYAPPHTYAAEPVDKTFSFKFCRKFGGLLCGSHETKKKKKKTHQNQSVHFCAKLSDVAEKLADYTHTHNTMY